MDNEGIRVFVHAGSSTFRRWWWRAWWKINWYPEFLAVLKGLPLMNRVWIEESKERIDI